MDVSVRGVVVFTHPKAELAIDGPSVPAMAAKQLKGWLRKAGKRTAIAKESWAELAEVLDEAAGVNADGD
jgi:hypothetical protein